MGCLRRLRVLDGMPGQVDELCPKLKPGFTNPWPFCGADGSYHRAAAFTAELCAEEIAECK